MGFNMQFHGIRKRFTHAWPTSLSA
jgi:hypothetical protein